LEEEKEEEKKEEETPAPVRMLLLYLLCQLSSNCFPQRQDNPGQQLFNACKKGMSQVNLINELLGREDREVLLNYKNKVCLG
jgi:hypothetical protein